MTKSLMELQELHLNASKPQPTRKQVENLRSQISNSYLSIFDRILSRSKKPVATVRHGVCGECHIRVAVGTLGSLAFGHGVQRCGNCGRFLYLPEDELVYGSAATSKPEVRSKKREVANAV